MQIDPKIIQKIEQRTYPFSDINVYHNAQRMADLEFQRCLQFFNRKIENHQEFEQMNSIQAVQKMAQDGLQIYQVIKEIEANHKEVLEHLAIKTISELYDVPENILMKAKIQDFNMKGVDVHKEKEIEKIEGLDEEIKKRIILNGYAHGSSVHIWKSIYHLVTNELNAINPELIKLYDVYAALTSMFYWIVPFDYLEQMLTQPNNGLQKNGSCKVKKNEKGKPEIIAEAINFPTLLHECNKGVIDYLILKGIPKDLTDDELKYIYQEADQYKDEIWHYFLSPTLWNDFIEGADKETQKLPKIIMNLSECSYERLGNIFETPLEIGEKLKYYKIIS